MKEIWKNFFKTKANSPNWLRYQRLGHRRSLEDADDEGEVSSMKMFKNEFSKIICFFPEQSISYGEIK